MDLKGTEKSVQTKYIAGIIGRIEMENILEDVNNIEKLKDIILISIINPNNKYEIVLNTLKKIDKFLNSEIQKIKIPYYKGNEKYVEKIFSKKDIKEIIDYKNNLENFLEKIRRSNSLEDRNSVPIDKNLLNLCYDSLTVSFWDIDFEEGIANYKPISDKEAKLIAKFIKRHIAKIKNNNKKFLIHCSAGISRSAGIGAAIHCIIDYECNIKKFFKNECKIFLHKRYMPNKLVFKKIIEEYKKLS